ncbi:hypothetical protein OAD94_02715 [Amylibacter sp.]|nr:hypothetical protein [Amylibacter sp.]
MALKKQNFAEGEIAIFDEACVYKRGEYWQFRLWLPKENERTNALKEVKRLCKEFGFTAGMLKGSLAEGRKKK